MAYTKSRSASWSLHNWFSTEMIARNAMVAALYFVLTIVSFPLSYNLANFRLSEFLNLLVFFNPAYTLGITIGCFLANTLSPTPWDMLIGTAATLAACLLMIPFRHLFLAGLVPCIVNAVVVGFELYYLFGFGPATPLWACMGWVMLGETVIINGLGYALFMTLSRTYKPVFKSLGATKNTEFVW